ncbi:MAG: hypothetical protein V4726_02365 [Verrucomicrobiota bacterium]
MGFDSMGCGFALVAMKTGFLVDGWMDGLGISAGGKNRPAKGFVFRRGTGHEWHGFNG